MLTELTNGESLNSERKVLPCVV